MANTEEGRSEGRRRRKREKNNENKKDAEKDKERQQASKLLPATISLGASVGITRNRKFRTSCSKALEGQKRRR